jgi:hypothetical protein
VSCERFEEICASDPGQAHSADLIEHARSCPDCATALSVLSSLREADDAFAAPEPAPEYWVRFTAALDGRLPAPSRAAPGFFMPRPWAKLALALGSCALLALCAVALLAGGGPRWVPTGRAPAAAAPLPAESDLLGVVASFNAVDLQDALNGLLPAEEDPTTADLADLTAPIIEESPPESPDDTPYDLFLDLPRDERRLMLEGIRAETG